MEGSHVKWKTTKFENSKMPQSRLLVTRFSIFCLLPHNFVKTLKVGRARNSRKENEKIKQKSKKILNEIAWKKRSREWISRCTFLWAWHFERMHKIEARCVKKARVHMLVLPCFVLGARASMHVRIGCIACNRFNAVHARPGYSREGFGKTYRRKGMDRMTGHSFAPAVYIHKYLYVWMYYTVEIRGDRSGNLLPV